MKSIKNLFSSRKSAKKQDVGSSGGVTNKDESPEEIIDIDGNRYKTIKIGNQLWMAENLKVTHYRNGDSIPNIIISSEWGSLTTGAYCNYNNNANNADACGRLYNWYAVIDPRGLAPDGWHVPSDAEWKQLEMHLGMSQYGANETGWRGTDESGKMKDAGTLHWDSPNKGATNESGFSALPGGYRTSYDGHFSNSGRMKKMSDCTFFWSSTEKNSLFAWERYMNYACSAVARDSSNKQHGFSVRCIRD